MRRTIPTRMVCGLLFCVSVACDRKPQQAPRTTGMADGAIAADRPLEGMPESQPEESVSLEAMLPLGETKVDVMGLAAPQDQIEIWERIQVGMKEHAAWLVEYMKEHARGGEPLPYHENFGVSRQEYERAMKTEWEVVRMGEGVLRIHRDDSGVLVLNGKDELADLNEIRIDIQRLILTTPLGDLSSPERKRAGESRTIGFWDGYNWSTESMDGDPLAGGSASSIEFKVGRIRKTGDAFIYYHARATSTGELTANARVFICYPMSPARVGRNEAGDVDKSEPARDEEVVP